MASTTLRDTTHPLYCKNTGDSNATIVNNTAFGNLNGSGNGNDTTGNANVTMTNNRLFGNLNLAGNGNALADGGNGTADHGEQLHHRQLVGQQQRQWRITAPPRSSGNRVMGDGSLSNNGNAPDSSSDGNAELINNTVIGNNSLSNNRWHPLRRQHRAG